MGTCLSVEANHPADFQSATKGISKNHHQVPRQMPSADRVHKIVIPPPKLNLGAQKDNVSPLLSPSEGTAATQPSTPMTPTVNMFADSVMVTAIVSPTMETLAEEEEEQNKGEFSSSKIDVGETVIESVIVEEESLGAPSDEEELHDVHLQNMENVIKDPNAKAEAPLLKQSQEAPARRGRETIRPPLIAPPKGSVPQVITAKNSVNPMTIANFNRLQMQVKLSKQAEKRRRRKAKVEDRFKDVTGYRNLWSEYEEIKQKVESDVESQDKQEEGRRRRANSMDLKKPDSWYFDFGSLKRNAYHDDDEADNQSHSSLSLFSELSMEAQRRLFLEKRKQRESRRKNRYTIRTKHGANDDASIASLQSTNSKSSVTFFRGKTDENDYGPVKQVTMATTSVSNQPMDVGSNDSTPRAKSKKGQSDDEHSMVSEIDIDNDYNVPRRRFRKQPNKSFDDSSLSTFEHDSYSIGGDLTAFSFDALDFQPRIFDIAPTTIEFQKKSTETPTAIQKYGFDPSEPLSAQLEMFSDVKEQASMDKLESTPSLGLPKATPNIWRGSPMRSLDEIYAEETGQGIAPPQFVSSKVSDHRLKSIDTNSEIHALSNDHEAVTFEEIPMSSLDCKKPGATKQETDQPEAKTSRTKQSEHDNPGKKVLANAGKSNNDTKEKSKSESEYIRPFHGMSTDHFRLMSTFSTSIDDDCGSCGSNLDSDERNEVTSNNNSLGIKSYDPLIEGMSTEAFLRLSTWHDPATQTSLSSDDEGKTTSLTEIADENLSCKPGDIHGEKSAQVSEKTIALTPLTNKSSSVEKLSPKNGQRDAENYDELADDVSNQIGALLQKYRQDTNTL